MNKTAAINGEMLAQIETLKTDGWLQQIDRQIDRQIGRWIERQIERYIDGQIDRQIDRKIDTCRQINS